MSTVNRISQIQSNLNAEAPARVQQTATAQQKTQSPAPIKIQAAPASSRDQADLSSTSVLLAHALSLPDVRTEKVAAIQQALADDTYHVSSADLAGKLIDTLQR